MVLHDDGSAVELAVVHKDIDVIAVKGISLGRQGRMRRVLSGRTCFTGQEGFRIFQDVGAKAAEILFQGLALACLEQFFLHRGEQGVQDLGHDGLFQTALIIVEAFLGLAQLAHEVGHALDERFTAPLEGHAQAVVQVFEFFLAQPFAFDQRVERKAAAFVHVQMEALVLGHGGHLVQQSVADLLETVHQPGALFDEGSGLETAGQLVQDGLHRGVHAPLELFALAGRKGQQARPVWVVEVMHIDQIRGRGPLAGLRPQIGEQGIAAPQIGITGNIDVVPAGPDAQGHVQSLHGSGLEGVAAAGAVTGQRDLPAVLPGDAVGIEGRVQPRRGQGKDFGHHSYRLSAYRRSRISLPPLSRR